MNVWPTLAGSTGRGQKSTSDFLGLELYMAVNLLSSRVVLGRSGSVAQW